MPVCKSVVSYIQCYLSCWFSESFLFSLLASCMELGNYCMSFLISLLYWKLCVDYVPLLLSIDLLTGVRTILAFIVVKEAALVELRSSNTSLAICCLSHGLLYFWLHKSCLQLVKLVDDGSSYNLMFVETISYSTEIDFSLGFRLLNCYDHLFLALAYALLVLWKIKGGLFIKSEASLICFGGITTNAHNHQCVNIVRSNVRVFRRYVYYSGFVVSNYFDFTNL